jgi:hypothetical protein
VEPFESLFRIDESFGGQGNQIPSVEAINKAWEGLEEKLELVSDWQDENNTIEEEAARFEVGDMERLRRVAKGKSCGRRR